MSIEQIIKCVCEQKGVSVAEIMGRERKVSLWFLRYMIWDYLHNQCGVTSNKLVAMFGRNRQSILRGIRVLKHDMRYNQELRDEYQALIKKIEEAPEEAPSENMEE